MSLRGRRNVPVGLSIFSWAGAPAILDDTFSASENWRLECRRQRPPRLKSTELIQSRRCCPRFAAGLFPPYRPHTEALGSSAQIRCVSPSCWRYRVASKKRAGSCVSQPKRELSPWLEFGWIPANLSDPSKRFFAPTFPSATTSSGLSRWSARAHNREAGPIKKP